MKKIICFGAAVLMALAATGCEGSIDSGESGGKLTVGGKTYNYDHAAAFIIPMQDMDYYNIAICLSNFEVGNMTDLDVPEGEDYDIMMIYYVSDVPDVATCSVRPYPIFDQDAELALPVWQLIVATGATGTSDPEFPELRYSYSSEHIFMNETPENIETLANEPDLNITKDGSIYRIEATDMMLCDDSTSEIVKVSFSYSGSMRIVEYSGYGTAPEK